MVASRCCCDDTTPGPGPGPIILCPDVNACDWNPSVYEFSLNINNWHSMRVAHYSVSGVPYCETVEVEWDYAATLYRTGFTGFLPTGGFAFPAWADEPNLVQIGPGQCDCGEFGIRQWRELIDIDCNADPQTRRNRGASFTTYRGFPATNFEWNECEPDPQDGCNFPVVVPKSGTSTATSAPQIIGTATRKLFNLSNNTLVQTQTEAIARNTRAVVACSFYKSSCVNGAQLDLTVFIGQFGIFGTGAGGGYQWFPQDEMDLHLVTFPPLSWGSTFNTYDLGFVQSGAEYPGTLHLVAPIGTGFPTAFDFIERPFGGKTVCCQPFGANDCNDGVIECTNDPNEKFPRCFGSHGNQPVNLWHCYRKPTVEVTVL